MARIMVVAGGKWQCPLVKMAKGEGHFVVCTNLYKDSPAFQYADKYAVVNVLDREANLKIAKDNKVDVVITSQSDIAVPTVAYISEQLKLKGIGLDTAERFTNKHIMRQVTSDAGFPSPKFRLCHSVEEAEEFVKEVEPSIIKPLDSQSSRGVHVVNCITDVRRYWDDCISYSNAEKAIVIEEYIDGREFTVDGLKTEDAYYVTAISEKSHFKNNPSVADRLIFSHDNDKYDYEKLAKVNKSMVEAMGLPFGLTHAEYKFRDGEFYLIEIAARGGGTRISSDIVPILSGIDSERVHLDILLGNKVKIDVGEKHNYAILGFFDFPAGTVTEISGVDDAKKIEGVIDVEIELSTGDKVYGIHDDRSRPGYYIVYADTKEQLYEREKKLKNMVRVAIER